MPFDGRPARPRPMTDEEIDRVIMRGSPFAMPGGPSHAVRRPRTLALGDMLRALFALAVVVGTVAGLGTILVG